MFRDFIRQARQEWGKMERYEASKGGELCHAMTSGEWSKPLCGAYKRILAYQSGPMGPTGQGSGGKCSHSGLIGGTKARPARDGGTASGTTRTAYPTTRVSPRPSARRDGQR